MPMLGSRCTDCTSINAKQICVCASINYNIDVVNASEAKSKRKDRRPDIVARLRPMPPGRAAPVMIGLRPPAPGLSIHGLPGGPPPEAKGEAFETIAPMDFGDREAQPEATPGTAIKRKG